MRFLSMRLRSAATALLALTISLSTIACRSESITHGAIAPPAVDLPLATSSSRASAVFAGGCFWGTQAVFERVKGVLATTAGYSGGSARTAHYDDVTTETTDHAESVEVIYDPSRLTYGQLLRVFFTIHDPTTLNRQGPDEGTSYRSAIFYANDDQKRIANAYIAQLDTAHAWKHRIVTQVVPLKAFFRAEDYHQDYALKNPNNPYIEVCDRPKITTLQTDYPDLYVPYKGH
jgi:peptide-methionine (S)-S-oxide reductase